MNNLLSQKWCLCLNVQNRIKLCRAKNHKFGDETTVGTYVQLQAYLQVGLYNIMYTSQKKTTALKYSPRTL